MFETHFAKYACDSDSITCSVDGFDVTARIVRDDSSDSPDERQDGFWPSLDPKDAGYIGPKSKATLARHMAKAQKVMDAWRADEWWYVGIVVTVERHSIKLATESLWGIECNYPVSNNSYLRDVANELLPEAISQAEQVIESLCLASGKQAGA